MSGASDAATALRAAALASYDALRDRVADTAKAVIRLREVDDLVAVMQAVNAVSLAADALAEAAKGLHESADAALVKSMESTGGTQFRTDSHVVSLRQNPPRVEITDPKAVPEAFLTTPKPQPDRALIRDALRNGSVTINWATLAEGSLGLQRKALTS
jgi:hypothetical protein